MNALKIAQAWVNAGRYAREWAEAAAGCEVTSPIGAKNAVRFLGRAQRNLDARDRLAKRLERIEV